ncbi:MAG: hypothetical protein RLZZ214_692 [Verrucomicrobiota bacterium]|jgi:hypothetical protein
MKTSPSRRWKAGYISTLLVLSTGSVLSLLMVYTYKRAMNAHATQSQVQLRVDYSEKEEAILRSIVAITPNRAIRAMQAGSNASTTVSNPLRWENIFTEALVLANARTSISTQVAASLGVANLRLSNTGDSGLTDASRIFTAIPAETGFVSAGINRSLGTAYPPPLRSANSTTSTRDALYPIITTGKVYDSLAQTALDHVKLNGDGTTKYGLPVATYPGFNRLKYPDINFGYAKPGEPFVAKRNWWAFSMDVADHDDDITRIARSRRNFVLSIYEIPSQLAISASSFMSLGEFASGSAWQNVTIAGGIFAGKAEVLGNTSINALSSRRGMTLSTGTTIGGQSFANNPFAPGVREAYQVTSGEFFPVSQASESGRAAFVPINRGAAFFDRFDAAENDPYDSSGARNHTASNVLSSTSWNNYSIGAQQCAMRLNVTAVKSATNNTPTLLSFEYYLSSGSRATEKIPLDTSQWLTTLPPGYSQNQVATENQSYTFSSTTPVDVAYGVAGGYAFIQGVTGTITFNNATFGDPKVGTQKFGYWRPRAPFDLKIANGQKCVAVYPDRIPSFLTMIGAAGPTVNNSLVVNVDYSTTGLNDKLKYKPNIPCTANDYGVILKECANFASYTKGFSLVTNLRLYIGDDFNVVPGTPPSGYTPTGTYYPPCSLFAPEKRYGVDVDPFSVILGGQIGSLAKSDKINASDAEPTAIRPLDSKNMSGTAMAASNITVNLRPIVHPADLPPITMMNWLVVLEERRKEFVNY